MNHDERRQRESDLVKTIDKHLAPGEKFLSLADAFAFLNRKAKEAS